MNYEVELKFRLADVVSTEARLKEMGAVESSTVSQIDRYFNHPSRDFHVTDEAFRIRSVGDANCVTYKGAVTGTVAKTRHEVEVDFAAGADAAKKLVDVLQLLGFRFVREVRKVRRPLIVTRGHDCYHLAIDTVVPLGQFLEIELLADASERERAEAAVWELAGLLGLTVAEPRSYLDMLLESDDSVS